MRSLRDASSITERLKTSGGEWERDRLGFAASRDLARDSEKLARDSQKWRGEVAGRNPKYFSMVSRAFFFSFPCAPRSSYRKIYIPQFYIFPSQRGHFFDFELRPNSTSKSWSSSPYAGTPAYCNANLSCIGPTHSSYLSEISGNAISSAFAASQPRTDLRKAFQR